ncbi:MAG: hypothetical protein GZ088_09765 [Acidipila sp.]|nr:hypothetical protein [Acidipila sp.]
MSNLNAMNEMYEMDAIEAQDATLRHSEGGGSVPREWQDKFAMTPILQQQYPYAMSGLGQVDPTPWYKSPAFIAIAGLGIAAVAYVIWDATKKPESAPRSESEGWM